MADLQYFLPARLAFDISIGMVGWHLTAFHDTTRRRRTLICGLFLQTMIVLMIWHNGLGFCRSSLRIDEELLQRGIFVYIKKFVSQNVIRGYVPHARLGRYAPAVLTPNANANVGIISMVLASGATH